MAFTAKSFVIRIGTGLSTLGACAYPIVYGPSWLLRAITYPCWKHTTFNNDLTLLSSPPQPRSWHASHQFAWLLRMRCCLHVCHHRLGLPQRYGQRDPSTPAAGGLVSQGVYMLCSMLLLASQTKSLRSIQIMF